MCKIILPYLDDSNCISLQSDKLILLCNEYIKADYISYQSFMFIDGTGYVEKVYQEIDFVLRSNQGNCHIEDVDTFIKVWGLEKYRHYKLSELSGGWKKFLGLALFTNINSTGKIYFDTFRQLSDRLIEILLSNLKNTLTKYTYFFEYDVTLFPNETRFEKVRIHSLDTGIKPYYTDINESFTETNY